ncbi:MAG: phosphodiester glycosidase family protein, partial [Rhodothermales bacterium]|nr:phosphodiester glycosidase family protein [Rhodothermales bacterium]
MRFQSYVTTIVLTAIFVLPRGAAAQNITWSLRTDLNENMPPGIRVFEGTDAALPLNAWYVEADPADTTWQVGALRSEDSDGLETTSSFAAGSEAWVAINGGYFGGDQSFSLVAQDGVIITPNIGALNRSGTIFWPTRSAFAVLDDSTPDVAWIYDVAGTQYFYPAPSPNAIGSPEPQPSAAFPEGGAPWPLGTGIGGGPVIVEDGQERITWEEEVFFGSGIGEITTRNPRTAVGYTAEGKIILL